MIGKIFSIAGRIFRSAPPMRDARYLAFVRSWPCIGCGEMIRPRDAMHTGPHGLGQKASDWDAVPGCRRCHEQLHRLGPVRFQLVHDLDFREAIEALQKSYQILEGRKAA